MIYSFTTSLFNSLPNSKVANDEYMFWWTYWQTIRDCLMGEIMVKARTTRYLPRLSKQSDDEYKAYLGRATFYNATSRTVSGLVGAVHAREPVIDNLPETIDLSNVTSDGQSFEMFVKKITKEVIAMGRYGVMIDAPESGGDPYFVGYDCEDIVDWSTTRVGSRDKLEYVVLRETRKVRKLFETTSDAIKETYRVLFIDEADGYYKQRVYAGEELLGEEYEEVMPLLQGRPMTEIPFLFISPYDFGVEVEKPPMLDIALLNLSHYQSYAQLEAGRFFAATPVYTVFLQGGGDEDTEFSVGANTVWQLGSQDRAEIQEFKGSGLAFLERALTSKEQQINSLGGKLAAQSAGVAAESADAIIAREKGEASFLGSVIATINEASSRLLSTMATWRGTPAQIRVTFTSDATQIYLDGREIRAMAMLYDTGLLPMETIFTIFRQNNIIPRGVSFEEFKAMLPEYAPKVKNKIDEAEEKAEIEVEVQKEVAKIIPAQAQQTQPENQAPPSRQNSSD